MAHGPAPPILAGVDRVDGPHGDMPDPAPGRPAAVVALPLHGGVHSDDLAVQSFARHLAEDAGSAGRSIIAGMRAFLEDKPDLLPDPRWTEPPPTGYRAVELLATAAGCSAEDIDCARRASRSDLAGSAWILEPVDGFEELLGVVAGRARLILVADHGDPATGAVLDALELADRVELLDEITLNTQLAQAPAALLIDTTWTSWLADAHAAGHTTALIDRFGVVGAGRGQADLTAPNLAGLLPGIAGWLDALATNREGAS